MELYLGLSVPLWFFQFRLVWQEEVNLDCQPQLRSYVSQRLSLRKIYVQQSHTFICFVAKSPLPSELSSLESSHLDLCFSLLAAWSCYCFGAQCRSSFWVLTSCVACSFWRGWSDYCLCQRCLCQRVLWTKSGRACTSTCCCFLVLG